MATIQIVKRAKPKRTGEHALQLRILMGGSSIRINTGKYVLPRHWDDRQKCLKRSHPNYQELSTELSSRITKAKRALLLLEAENPDFTISMLKSKLVNGYAKKTFFAQADDFFETLMLGGKINRVQGERPVVRHLYQFVKGKDLAFADVTPALLTKFRAYLEGTVGLNPQSIASYMSTLRTIYNRGIEDGHAKWELYPFGRGKGKIKIKVPHSLKIGLEDYEVSTIETLVLDKSSFIHHARNIWLFSFYLAGMRISDVLLLKWDAISGNRLHYTMGKNAKPGSTIIPPKAQTILDEYELIKDEKTGLVFPDMRDSPSLTDRLIYKPLIKNRGKKINKYLKDIAELAGIDKPLTLHIARHTFGNIAGDKIPLQLLQQLYRHTDITTTVNYQRAFMNKSTDEALMKVVNFEMENTVPISPDKVKLRVV